MGLSTDELNAIRAQWEEWAPDEFRLDIEVCGIVDKMAFVLSDDSNAVNARARAEALHCRVRIWHGEELVFSERTPHDAALLRASVTTLARTIATRWPPPDE